jgi:hypothetical protein
MLTGHRSVTRRRSQRSRAARVAVPLAIPVALGVALGIFIAVSNNGHATSINQSAFGRHRQPGASATPTTGGTTAPTASASAPAAGSGAAVAPASSFANGAVARFQLGDVATTPVDGTGAAINMQQNADEAANSLNCTIAVPANPLSAQGLATPYRLGDGCTMANGSEEAFVEATILAPNGSIQVYNPLVIDAGTQPAAAPQAPTIARGSSVIIDFGFNGTNLVLTGAGARQGGCVDALGQSVFGQVAACGAVNFYNAANAAIARGTLKVPAAGNATDGQACQTARDFALIDQDQSDNVISQYLLTANGQVAQATAANKTALAGAQLITNGSDMALLAEFVDPANGCTPFMAPDATNPNGAAGSQALNELSARVNQKGTIALVPTNDEMTLVGGNMSVAKTNAYRSLVDQPLLGGGTSATAVAASYCQNMENIQAARNQLDMAADSAFGSPVADVGNNLATFLGNRLAMSFTNLNCGDFGLTNASTPTLDGNGVATAVTYNLTQQTAKGAAGGAAAGGAGGGAVNAGAGQNTGTQSRGGRRHFFQNPSGM